MVAPIPYVQGECPMGCGPLLVLGEGGHVTCSYIDCPEPSAVDTILGQRLTDHILKVTDTSWTIQHPLKERLPGQSLFDCAVPSEVAYRIYTTEGPGLYKIEKTDDEYAWERVPDA